MLFAKRIAVGPREAEGLGRQASVIEIAQEEQIGGQEGGESREKLGLWHCLIALRRNG